MRFIRIIFSNKKILDLKVLTKDSKEFLDKVLEEINKKDVNKN